MNIQAFNTSQSSLNDYSIHANSTKTPPNMPPDKKIEEIFSSCHSSIKKMAHDGLISRGDLIRFAEDLSFSAKCEEHVKWKSNLAAALNSVTSTYNSRKIEIWHQCQAVVRTEQSFKEQLELLKQGNPSLFSSSNSEPTKIFLQFPHHDGNSATTKWAFQDLTNKKLSFPPVHFSAEDAYPMCDGHISDKILESLTTVIEKQFESLPSLDDATSFSELRQILDAIEEQRESVEKEILTKTGKLQAEALSAMINAQNKIENNISSMLKSVCSVVENPSEHSIIIENCQTPLPPPEKPSYLIYILGLSIFALGSLYFVRKSKQAKTEKLSESVNNPVRNPKYWHHSKAEHLPGHWQMGSKSKPTNSMKMPDFGF